MPADVYEPEVERRDARPDNRTPGLPERAQTLSGHPAEGEPRATQKRKELSLHYGVQRVEDAREKEGGPSWLGRGELT